MKKWLIFIGLCFVSLYAYSWGSGGSSSYSYETFKPSSATTVQIQYIGSIFKNDNKIYFTDEMKWYEYSSTEAECMLYNDSGNEVMRSTQNSNDHFYSRELNGSASIENNYSIVINYYDFSSNKYSSSKTYYVYKDTTAPEFTLMARRHDASGIPIPDDKWTNATEVGVYISGLQDKDDSGNNGSGVDKTSKRYSLDGGTTFYSLGEDETFLKISNAGIYNVVVKVKDNVGNEQTRNYTVKIDWTAPVTPGITSVKDASGADYTGSWKNTSKVTITLSGDNDGGRYEKQVGTGSWTTCTSPVEITAEGTTEIKFRSVDKAGNLSSATEVKTVKIDRTAPNAPTVTMKDASGNTYTGGWTNTSKVAITLSGDNDGGRYEKQVGTGSWTTCTSPVEITAEGTTEIKFRSVDKAGNPSSATEVKTVKIDRTAPVTPGITSVKDASGNTYPYPGTEWTNKTKVAITLSGDNDGGRYEKQVGTGSWTTCTSPVEITAEGTTEIKFRSVDKAGNPSSATEVKTVKIDRTAPVTPGITSVKDASGADYTGSWKNTSKVTITLTGSNDGGRYEKQVGTGSWTTCTSPVEITAEGTTEIKFRSVDKAGNPSSATEVKTVKIDRTAPNAPTVTMKDASNNTYTGSWRNTSKVAITLTGSNDGGRYEKQVGTGSWTTCTSPVEITAEGTTEIKFRSVDKAGNPSSATEVKTVKIDRTAPNAPTVTMKDASGNTYTGGWTNTSKVAITLSGSNDGGRYEKQVGTGSWTTCTSPVEITAEGTTEIKFRSVDKAGNPSSATEVKTVKIDRTAPNAPTVTMKDASGNTYPYPGTEWTNKTKVAITLTGSNDGGRYEKQVGTGSWTTCTSPVEITAEGTTEIKFRSVDKAGNPSSATEVKTVKIDRTAPNAPTVTMKDTSGNTYPYPGTEWTNKTKVAITLTGSNDGGRYEKQVGTGSWTTCTSPVEITAEGTTEIKFRSVDKAGNPSSATEVKTVKIDWTKPVIKSVGYTSNGRNLAENNMIYYKYVNNKAIAEINFNINAEDIYSEKSALRYRVSVKQKSSSNIDPKVTKSVSSFTVSTADTNNGLNLGQGENTVYVTAIDEAENESEPVLLTVYDNKFAPAVPVFEERYCNVPRASTDKDAVADNNIKFGITSVDGIEAYEYKLYIADVNSETKSTFEPDTLIEIAQDARIEFNQLEDNNENEFYLLSVKARGTNGQYSEPSTYLFRVDTTPPYYQAWFDSNPANTIWYSNKRFTLKWVEKEDPKTHEKTGVKDCYYRVFPGDQDIDYESISLDEFTQIKDPSTKTCDITFSNDGEYVVVMAFEDYAGNVEYDEKHPRIKIDSTAPSLEQDTSKLITSKLQDGKITFNNIFFTDDVNDKQYSGLKKIEFNYSRLKEEDEENTVPNGDPIYKEPSSNGIYLIEANNIAENNSYLVNITCYDNSVNNTDNTGNNTNIVKTVFGTNKERINKEQIQKYKPEKTNKGFNIDGDVVYNVEEESYSRFNGTITLPENLEAKITLDSEEIKSFTPKTEEVSFDGNTIVSAKSNNTSNKLYNVKLGDVEFECEDIGYSSEKDLMFYKISYKQTLKNGKTQNISFDEGNAKIASKLKLNTIPSAAISPAINIKEPDSVFNINNVDSIQFVDGAKLINGTNLSTEFSFSNGDVEINKDNGNKVKLNTVTSGNKSLTASFKTKDNELLMNGMKYTIEEASIKGNEISVKEAYTSITLGGNNYTLILRDFIISSEGTVSNLGLSIEVKNGEESVTRLTDGTATIEVKNITLTSTGHLSCSSGEYVNSANNSSLTFNNIEITDNGFDYSETTINSFVFEIFGYSINTGAISATKENITVNGTITVQGVNFSFNGLQYVPVTGKVLNEITLNEYGKTTAGTLTIDTKNYGKRVTYTNLRIKPDGLYADAAIPLPYNTGTENNLTLSAIKLNSDGTVVAEKIKTEQTVVYGTYTITTDTVSFNGSNVTVEAGTIDVSGKGFSKGSALTGLSVKGLSFNYSNIITRGIIDINELNYSFDGWNFIYSDKPVLTNVGIKGSGIINNETDDYLFNLEYSDFNVTSDKTVTSGTANNDPEKNYFFKDHYLYTLKNASFVKDNNDSYILNVENPETEVNTYTSAVLKFGTTKIKSDATILNGESISQDSGTKFISVNGYNIVPKTAKITDEGILLTGKLSTDELESESDFAAEEMELSCDFVVETKKNPASTITYHYNGWEINGTDVEYYYDKIIINNNKVTFRGQQIELGKLEFNSYYELENSSSREQNVSVNLLSSNINAQTKDSTIRYTKFSEEGLVARIDVTLPQPFQNCTIGFDEIYLEANGDFYVRTIKQRKEFGISEDLKVELQDIIIGNFGVKAGYISLTMPSLSADQPPITITLEGLEVGEKEINGEKKVVVLIEGSAVSPFTIFDMTFCIQNFSIKETGFSFTGYTILPGSLPGMLSGMMIGVDQFNIDWNGNITHVGVNLVGTYNIPFEQGFSINFSDLGVEISEDMKNPGEKNIFLTLQQAYLNFPPEYKVTSVGIENFKFNLKTGKPDFDQIVVNSTLDFDISGIKLILSSFTITNNRDEDCLDFTLNTSAEFGEKFPLFLQKKEDGTKPDVKGTVTLSTGNTLIKNVSLSASNLNGPITEDNNILNISNGNVNVGITNNGKDLSLAIGGKLQFTDNAPDGLRGLDIDIKSFVFADKKIKELKASGALGSVTVSNVEMQNLYAEVNYSEENINPSEQSDVGYVKLSGKIIIPDTIPEESVSSGGEKLSGTEIDIQEFTVKFNSEVTLIASLDHKNSVVLFDSLNMSNIHVDVNYQEKKLQFATHANVAFTQNVIDQGLPQINTTIDLKFNGKELISGYVDASIPDNTLIFDVLKTNNVKLKISKNTGSTGKSSFGVSLTGNLILPGTDKLPEGLANTVIGIEKFDYTLGGNINEFKASVSKSSIDIYDYLTVINPYISFELKTPGSKDFIITIGKKDNANIPTQVKFNEKCSVPAPLKDASLQISDCSFQIGSENKLISFNVKINKEIKFDVMNGLQLSVDSLNISDKGFSVAASADFTYEKIELDAKIKLSKFEMDWHGKIINLEGELDHAKAVIAGFTAEVKGLKIQEDKNDKYGFGIKIAEISLVMPAGGGLSQLPTLSIVDASVKNGKFTCKFKLDEYNLDIAGFKLKLEKPDIDYTNKSIKFSNVSMDMPKALKSANINLKDVKISAAKGLEFNGGSVKLPDFQLSEGVGFTNVHVDFVLNGSEYSIEGEGGLALANAGEMYASLSFTNISKTYPIGLKKAYFSFEASNGKGIDLGTTGLVLSGIRGGLAFGAPDEVPANMRYMFDNDGIRIQLGLTVKDKANGNLVSMKPDTWIDVKNFAWAFSGKLYVLTGTLNLSAQADAALSKYGFYTGLAFKLTVVKGSVEFFIFDPKDGSKTKFAGQGDVQFGLKKGALVDKSFKLFGKKVGIIIPTSDIWLGKINAEFGDFKGNKRGFKAFTSFLGFGEFGIFVGNSDSLKIGGVSEYVLCKPEGAVSISKVIEEQEKNNKKVNANGKVAKIAPVQNVSVSQDENLLKINRNAVKEDKVEEESLEKTYQFTVRGKKHKGITIKGNNQETNSNGLMLSASSVLRSNSVQEEEETDSGLNRIIFICAYTEGDPEFCAISPTGKEYYPGDPSVVTSYMEDYLTFMVYNPEPGDWTFRVDNIEEGLYAVELLTVDSLPTATINEPEYSRKAAGDYITVSGTVSEPYAEVTVYAAESKDSPMFQIATLISDDTGYYSGKIKTDTLKDGEYYLCVNVQTDEENVSKTSYSEGTYLIDRADIKLNPPSELNVTERENTSGSVVKESVQIINEDGEEQFIFVEKKYNSLYAIWNNTNGARTGGYNLKIETNEETKILNVGNVNEYTLSNIEPGTSIALSVQTYDDEGNTSDYTEPVVVEIGGKKQNVNKPEVIATQYSVTGHNSEMVSGEIKVAIEDYVKTNSNMDYIRGKVLSVNNMDEEGNEYFSISFNDFVEINENETLVPWEIMISDTCPKGIYTIEGQIVNEGNFELTSDFTIELEVKYPVPVISSVEPSEIDGTQTNTVTIFGEGFIAGSRYFFDGNEIIVQQEQDKNLIVNRRALSIPECTTRGVKQISVVGPDGDSCSYGISVNVPDWKAYTLIESATVLPGEKAVFPVMTESLDDYTGTATFVRQYIPAGFYLTLPEIKMNSTDNIVIDVDESVEAGDYTIIVNGSNGSTLELAITVLSKETVLEPTIIQISPYSVFVGDKVTVYGYGFGKTGKLYYDGNEIEAEEWYGSAVSFIVQEDMKTGTVYLETENGKSNAAILYVRERGFNLRPSTSEVILEKNVTKTVYIAVNGYAERADLELNYDPDLPIKATLSKQTVIPNASVELILEAQDYAENGEYKVVVIGTCGDFSTRREITIVLGDRLVITTDQLYEGKIGVPYKAKLETKNGAGKVTFECENGSLQSGLKFGKDGVISGTPSEDGLRTITIKALDEDGQIAVKDIQILVSDNAWASKNKDSGNSRTTTAEMPSTSKKEWTVDVMENAPVILASESELFVYDNNSITAYNDRGRFKWTKEIRNKKVQVIGHYIFVLSDSEENVLYAIDKVYGNTVWETKGVNAFTAGDSLLITRENNRVNVYNAEDGALINVIDNTHFDIGNVLWIGNKAYECTGNVIKGIYTTDAVYTAQEEIESVSCDTEGFVVVTQNAVIILDAELKETVRTVNVQADSYKTALDETKVFVTAGTVMTSYDRNTLNTEWSVSDVYEYAVAMEKIITISDNQIAVYNEYNGKLIWNEEGSYTSLALYGEKIYAAKEGELIAYNGKSNATAPSTTITVEPSEPTGNNGWYKESMPTITVEAEDKETYVEKLLVERNSEGWKEYEGTSFIPEGFSIYKAYGVDNKDYHGNIESVSTRVDVTKPVSNYKITDNVDVTDWISEDVTLELYAEDNVSGVAEITVNNGKYTKPIEYKKEGIYDVKWYATDIAGNMEDEHKITLMIDKYSPTVSSTYKMDRGIAVIDLEAKDSFSGVDYIEYSIDNSSMTRYESTIFILKEGKHTVKYQAFDKCGKTSGIKTLELNIPKETARGKVLALAELNGESETINDTLTYGSMLYVNDSANGRGLPSDFWSKAYFATLPSYVLNTEYIQFRGSKMHLGGERTITWYLKKDAVMYMFAGPEMQVDSSWTLVQKNVGIQTAWYAKGWNLYMRRAKQCEKVEVKVDSKTQALPVIAVRENPVLKTSITLTRNPYWDDYKYNGRKPYRTGVQVQLSVKESPSNIESLLPVTKEWTVVEDGKERKLESLWYNIPSVTHDTTITFRYKVISADGKVESMSETTITASAPDAN